MPKWIVHTRDGKGRKRHQRILSPVDLSVEDLCDSLRDLSSQLSKGWPLLWFLCLRPKPCLEFGSISNDLQCLCLPLWYPMAHLGHLSECWAR